MYMCRKELLTLVHSYAILSYMCWCGRSTGTSLIGHCPKAVCPPITCHCSSNYRYSSTALIAFGYRHDMSYQTSLNFAPAVPVRRNKRPSKVAAVAAVRASSHQVPDRHLPSLNLTMAAVTTATISVREVHHNSMH